ncbi:MAG: hypothetical protein AAGD01_05225 [Acidobacteriota bacterium]
MSKSEGRPDQLSAGDWLGIDIGSGRDKILSLCRIHSDGRGEVSLHFEKGPAAKDGAYPSKNSRDGLLDPIRAPTYLLETVEAEIGATVSRSELVERWLDSLGKVPVTVAVDAPVALCQGGETEGRGRLTEQACSQSFYTPDRLTFEAELARRKDEYLRINNFWKCVGFAVYRAFARRLDPEAGELSQENLAAWTVEKGPGPWKIRETFPSDIYKRSRGVTGLLGQSGREVLTALTREPWQAAGNGPRRPSRQAIQSLESVRRQIALDLEANSRLCEMRRQKSASWGDLWDAFTCAFAACCEDHGAGHLHGVGLATDGNARKRLAAEGAILTVACAE